ALPAAGVGLADEAADGGRGRAGSDAASDLGGASEPPPEEASEPPEVIDGIRDGTNGSSPTGVDGGRGVEPSRLPGPELPSMLGLSARGSDVPRRHRIFVNRNLRMDQVDLIGFDMDYTLAIYDQPRIEALSMQCTLRKLVEGRGYPEEILALDYDPSFAIRG